MRARDELLSTPHPDDASLMTAIAIAFARNPMVCAYLANDLQLLCGGAKYIGIIMGITFASLLITQQSAIFLGLMTRTYGAVTDLGQAEICVADPKVQFIDDIKPLQDTQLLLAARTGLTALVKAVSKEVAADNVTLNNLLPERFDTDRQRQMARLVMAVRSISYEEARAELQPRPLALA